MSASLEIATFNLKDLFDARSDAERATVEQKVANVSAILARANADVVALQEVASDALLARLARPAGDGPTYSTIHRGPVDRRGIGCAILTRLPVVERDVISAELLAFPRFAENDAVPFAKLPLRRPVVHLSVDAPGFGVVDVLTVHFKSRLGAPMRDANGEPVLDGSPHGIAEAQLRAWVQRAAEALHLRTVVDRLFEARGDRSVALVGDFNDTLDAVPTRVVRGAFHGVDPTRQLASATDRIEAARRFSILHVGTPDLIDHILLSPSLAARQTGASIFNEALRDHGPHVPDAPLAPDSDHALVIAQFA